MKVDGDSASSASASADNGLGVSGSSPSDSHPGEGDGHGATVYSVDCTSTRYSVQSGATITLHCSPTANATSIPGAANVNVLYNVTAAPVTIDLAGVTDAETAPKVLTGQQIIASISAGVAQPLTYNWSNDSADAIFAEWNKNNGVLTLIPPNTTAQYAFYTRKEVAALTVSCTATVTFPDGTPGLVSAQSRPLHSVKPVATWDVTSASARLNVDPADGPAMAGNFGAFAINPFGYGQDWKAKFSIAAPFSGGEAAFLQLATFSRQEYILNATAKPYRNKEPNSGEVLDTGFPYFIAEHPTGLFTVPDDPDEEIHLGDAPRAFLKITAKQNVAKDKFKTWLMYKPPAFNDGTTTYPVRWVPLQKYTWLWGATATQDVISGNGTGSWTLTGQSGATATAREPTSDFPSWSVVQNGGFDLIPDNAYEP